MARPTSCCWTSRPTISTSIPARRWCRRSTTFAGAVVLISHDPHLIELTVDRFWLVKDGRCQPFDGDLNDYKDMILSPGRAANERERRGKAEPKSAKKTQASAGPGDLKRQVEQSAVAVQKLTEAMRLIEKKMADRGFYEEPAKVVADWQRKHTDVARRLEKAEEAWLQAQMALELAQ